MPVCFPDGFPCMMCRDSPLSDSPFDPIERIPLRQRMAVIMMAIQHPKQEDTMSINRIRDFLDSHHVKYFVVSHSPAYTAQDIAAAAHVSGKEMVKTVMVTIDGRMAMVLLPATRTLDFELLGALCGTRDVALAEEQEFSELFPECEIGAMPPLGNLYGIEVYADDELENVNDIAFNAGTHRELLRLSWADYRRLVNPLMATLTHKP
jgi:Ala-tRNA(Pro) deacylase